MEVVRARGEGAATQPEGTASPNLSVQMSCFLLKRSPALGGEAGIQTEKCEERRDLSEPQRASAGEEAAVTGLIGLGDEVGVGEV